MSRPSHTRSRQRQQRTGTAGKTRPSSPSSQTRQAPKQASIHNLFSSSELVLVRKDLNAMWSRKGIRALLMGLPMVLVVILPVVFFAAISLLPASENAQLPEAILALLPPGSGTHGYRQFWMEAFTTLLCPALFLSVPIVCAVTSASCVFIGEKENGTLETLLLSAVPARSVFNAKITCCALVSVFISLVSFVAFTITVSVADIMISAPFFFSLDWVVLAVFLMPVLTVFSVSLVSLVLPNVFSVGESLQIMGYLLLPVIGLYLVQFAGVFRINILLLVALTVVLAAASVFLFNVSARKFQAERLLPKRTSLDKQI